MTDSSIRIRLIGDSDCYEPGDTLAGEFFVEIDEPEAIRVVEISALWYTEGKGEEDLAVHFFERVANDNGEFVDMRQSQPFTTKLPASPLSYDGVIVKIYWCVRIRVFLTRGREFSGERSFQLGRVPAGVAVAQEPSPNVEDEAGDQAPQQ